MRQAASILGLSPQRVGFYIRRGDLPASTVNGLDYVLQRQDVARFHKQRQSGKRQTTPGRPGPDQLAKLQPQREAAALNRERLRQQLRRAADGEPEPQSEPEPTPDARETDDASAIPQTR